VAHPFHATKILLKIQKGQQNFDRILCPLAEFWALGVLHMICILPERTEFCQNSAGIFEFSAEFGVGVGVGEWVGDFVISFSPGPPHPNPGPPHTYAHTTPTQTHTHTLS
jgi:hypothetical protein